MTNARFAGRSRAGATPPTRADPLIAASHETRQNPPLRLSPALASQRDQILALAAARGATRLRVVGAVANGLDHAESDIDLLFDMPHGTSLLRIVGLQMDIEAALGVRVDRCPERELQPDLKLRVLAQARLFLNPILGAVAEIESFTTAGPSGSSTPRAARKAELAIWRLVATESGAELVVIMESPRPHAALAVGSRQRRRRLHHLRENHPYTLLQPTP